MKTLIRVVKREARDQITETDASTPINKPATTEMIVKRWIIESRENRRAALNQLQDSFGLTR